LQTFASGCGTFLANPVCSADGRRRILAADEDVIERLIAERELLTRGL